MPNRIAAQITKGNTMYSSGYGAAYAKRCVNTAAPAAVRPATSAQSSMTSFRFFRRRLVLHVNSTGATSRSPAASPSHQVHQSGRNAAHGCNPPAQRLVTPIVALTTVLITAPKTTSPRVYWKQVIEVAVPTNQLT